MECYKKYCNFMPDGESRGRIKSEKKIASYPLKKILIQLHHFGSFSVVAGQFLQHHQHHGNRPRRPQPSPAAIQQPMWALNSRQGEPGGDGGQSRANQPWNGDGWHAQDIPSEATEGFTACWLPPAQNGTVFLSDLGQEQPEL
jgi:hypothetical protein